MASKAVTYVPRPMGTLDANQQKYLQAEFASISQSIKSIIAEIEKINARLAAYGVP
jgi:hypothetical protein